MPGPRIEAGWVDSLLTYVRGESRPWYTSEWISLGNVLRNDRPNYVLWESLATPVRAAECHSGEVNGLQLPTAGNYAAAR